MQAIPVAIAINNTRANIPNIVIINSGGQRFDIYSGPFTKNDQLTASPFVDIFQFIPNVPFSVANAVLPALNKAGANERRALFEKRNAELYGRGEVDTIYRKWLEEMDTRNNGIERRAANNLTLGYVTSDVSPLLVCSAAFRVLRAVCLLIVLPWRWRRHPPCASAILRQP